ncbi:hypothetical protein [Paenibacillus brasilensis]|uniref:Uncharacterized protein n=1 Tax=Paenibacillus brasilensis TaxID=128574 RepID=A0ABU0KZY8_9BACL|nr:hypothetical protein [Paenibacillus brasilensis]MDQ0494849.1 hypothetical protein [Paenibacillus brasilensis]
MRSNSGLAAIQRGAPLRGGIAFGTSFSKGQQDRRSLDQVQWTVAAVSQVLQNLFLLFGKGYHVFFSFSHVLYSPVPVGYYFQHNGFVR